ncbi:serine/threonine protein phosphatase [Spirochaetia bacterium]|nr:serine/threonine protein phosphatase [Spirochaetia bacterium]
MWVFRSVFMLLLYLTLNLYIGLRFFAFGRLLLPSLKGLIFWPCYVLLASGFIFIALFRLDWIGPLRILGMYWPAAFVYLFLFLLVFDLAGLGFKQFRLMPAGAGAAFCLTLVLLVYGSLHARNIRTTYYELSIPRNPGMESFRLVLVSDLHISPTVDRAWTAKIVDRINEASPDMVCIAGDIFDSGLETVADQAGIAAELRRISAPLGVYGCLGNHDTDRSSRSTDRIAAFLKDTGMIVLQDEIYEAAAGLYVAGRKDARPIGVRSSRLTLPELAASFSGFESSSKEELSNLPAPARKAAVILLDHQPVELPQTAAAGFDLVLCGHTHRGQFFPGNIITRWIFQKSGGTHYGYWQKDAAQAVVTSGAGVWGPPVRIGTHSEIAVLDLRFTP